MHLRKELDSLLSQAAAELRANIITYSDKKAEEIERAKYIAPDIRKGCHIKDTANYIKKTKKNKKLFNNFAWKTLDRSITRRLISRDHTVRRRCLQRVSQTGYRQPRRVGHGSRPTQEKRRRAESPR